MKKGVIITLPQSDDVTEYLVAFFNPILDEISKYGVIVKLLKKEGVTRVNFENTIKSYNYNAVFFNGHGDIDCITGHKQEEIILAGENESLLLGRIIYARSCWAAEGLGKSIIGRDNSGCFIGFNIPFMFLYDVTRISNPIKDHIAEIFFETANMAPLSIIKGKTSGEGA